jgi:hypothetical protein
MSALFTHASALELMRGQLMWLAALRGPQHNMAGIEGILLTSSAIDRTGASGSAGAPAAAAPVLDGVVAAGADAESATATSAASTEATPAAAGAGGDVAATTDADGAGVPEAGRVIQLDFLVAGEGKVCMLRPEGGRIIVHSLCGACAAAAAHALVRLFPSRVLRQTDAFAPKMPASPFSNVCLETNRSAV